QAQWFIAQSSAGPRVVDFGAGPDVPIPADYDGDGRADPATYRPAISEWFLLQSSAGPRNQAFGAANVDIPVPADYDADGAADLPVSRPTTGQWLIQQSTAGPRVQSFGGPNLDVPLPTPLAYRYRGALLRTAGAGFLASSAPVSLVSYRPPGARPAA